MTPVKFWDRGVNPWPATPSGLRPTWDPQDPPGEFDSVRDDLLVGDMFDPDWPEPVRHPSKQLLETSHAPHTPRVRPAVAPDALPPSHGVAGATAPLTQKQPGRGRDQAA